MKKKIVCALLGMAASLSAEYIHEHGYWVGADIEHQHLHDRGLSHGIAMFLQRENAASAVDFGCGLASYTKVILAHGINCDAYDGNPDTPEVTGGIGKVQDLSQPFDLGKRYEWVVCLEVGEHLPKQYESTLIENIHRHNTKGVILTWAHLGQGGYGHFNCQDPEYIKGLFAELGYINDIESENELRQSCHVWEYRKTVMVFRRP